jgi:hypothetical protein
MSIATNFSKSERAKMAGGLALHNKASLHI